MNDRARVGIIMGNQNDLSTMIQASEILKELTVPFELTVVSAHRSPCRLIKYASSAQSRGLKVIIAGAGAPGHLPGMVASLTPLPVIGVPLRSAAPGDAQNSVLSMTQMSVGVPVATVGIDGAKNAGLLAAQMLATSDDLLLQRIVTFKRAMEEKVLQVVDRINIEGYEVVLRDL